MIYNMVIFPMHMLCCLPSLSHPRQRRRDLEADLDSLEANRAQLLERETLLSTRAKKAESREAEVRRLRRETDEDRAGLDGARQACLDRERALSGMEEALRERESEAVEAEVGGVGCWRVCVSFPMYVPGHRMLV